MKGIYAHAIDLLREKRENALSAPKRCKWRANMESSGDVCRASCLSIQLSIKWLSPSASWIANLQKSHKSQGKGICTGLVYWWYLLKLYNLIFYEKRDIHHHQIERERIQLKMPIKREQLSTRGLTFPKCKHEFHIQTPSLSIICSKAKERVDMNYKNLSRAGVL